MLGVGQLLVPGILPVRSAVAGVLGRRGGLLGDWTKLGPLMTCFGG